MPHPLRSWTVSLASLALLLGAAGAVAGGSARALLDLVPHRVKVSAALADGSFVVSVALPEVPAGKRFVVEHLTAQATVGVGQSPTLALYADAAGQDPLVFIPLSAKSSFIVDFYQASLPVRLYLGPGAGPVFQVVRAPPNGEAGATLVLSGHLIDAP